MGTVFTDRFHLVVIKSPSQMGNALLYGLRNDLHHTMGLKTLDPCSSAPFFRGWSDHKPQSEHACTTRRVNLRPQEWILQLGWQKGARPSAKLLSIHDTPRLAKGVRIQPIEA